MPGHGLGSCVRHAALAASSGMLLTDERGLEVVIAGL